MGKTYVWAGHIPSMGKHHSYPMNSEEFMCSRRKGPLILLPIAQRPIQSLITTSDPVSGVCFLLGGAHQFRMNQLFYQMV